MTPQKPPPKPYAVARVETVYTYHDEAIEAEAQYSDQIKFTFPFGDGITIELWDGSTGEWTKKKDQEFPPMAVTEDEEQ